MLSYAKIAIYSIALTTSGCFMFSCKTAKPNKASNTALQINSTEANYMPDLPAQPSSVVTVGTLVAPKNNPSTTTENTAILSKTNYKYLTSKGKLDFAGFGEELNANFTLRMANDSLIWASFSQFGIEGARVLCRKDSIFLRNDLDETVSFLDYNQLSAMVGMPVNFSSIENLILADWPHTASEIIDNNNTSNANSTTYMAERDKAGFKQTAILNQQTQKVQVLTSSLKGGVQDAKMQYAGFVGLPNGNVFAMQKVLVAIIKDSYGLPSSLNLQLEHTKVDLIPKSLPFPTGEAVALKIPTFPFSVPNDYKRLR